MPSSPPTSSMSAVKVSLSASEPVPASRCAVSAAACDWAMTTRSPSMTTPSLSSGSCSALIRSRPVRAAAASVVSTSSTGWGLPSCGSRAIAAWSPSHGLTLCTSFCRTSESVISGSSRLSTRLPSSLPTSSSGKCRKKRSAATFWPAGGSRLSSAYATVSAGARAASAAPPPDSAVYA